MMTGRLFAATCLLLAFGACRAEGSLVKSESEGAWLSKSETSDSWHFLYYGADGRGAAAFYDRSRGSGFCFRHAAETNGVMSANLTGSQFHRATVFFGGFKLSDGTPGLLTGTIFLFSQEGTQEKLFNTMFLRLYPVADASQLPSPAKQLMVRCGLSASRPPARAEKSAARTTGTPATTRTTPPRPPAIGS
ncbi:hypothetical protein LYSHEL_26300 [Lysobacter helvus]|uniref:Uncharacterized protein n=2 Tax=Lysobacteraceae TaxID=32033 RepID=A0ABM7Q8D2_9GAMM|nr:hypothetical protein LYSCAS_26290 [Lysobacter caseinilyticus]BCT96759.1 hypothetical protein LYSHEL_26300 [Lysobacter helvus]